MGSRQICTASYSRLLASMLRKSSIIRLGLVSVHRASCHLLGTVGLGQITLYENLADLVITIFSPFSTGHPPCRACLSKVPLGWMLMNMRASPFLGWYCRGKVLGLQIFCGSEAVVMTGLTKKADDRDCSHKAHLISLLASMIIYMLQDLHAPDPFKREYSFTTCTQKSASAYVVDRGRIGSGPSPCRKDA